VQVHGFPHVGVAAELEQALAVPRRLGDPPRNRRLAELRRETGIAPERTQDFVRGRLVVVRHLHRERAARREEADETREQRVVIGHPLERRVRHDAIERRRRLPRTQIGVYEAQPRRRQAGRGVWRSVRPCARQHRLRRIDAHDLGAGPAREQAARQFAGATTEIGGAPHGAFRYARDEIVERLRALAREALVLRRIPARRLVGPCHVGSRTAGVRVRARSPPRRSRPR
jgi:hypothetical protein